MHDLERKRGDRIGREDVPYDLNNEEKRNTKIERKDVTRSVEEER